MAKTEKKTKTPPPGDGSVVTGQIESAGDAAAISGSLTLDATDMDIPISQLFEHPSNLEFRLYGKAAKESLRQLVRKNARGVARHKLTVAPVLNEKGKPVSVKQYLTRYPLAKNPSLSAYLAAHPEIKESNDPAFVTTAGNHRLEIYREEGFTLVPCTSQEMSLEEQLDDLVAANLSKPLSRLEFGLAYLETLNKLGHRGKGRIAQGSEEDGISQNKFAEKFGKSKGFMSNCVDAAREFKSYSPETQARILNYLDDGDRFTPEHFRLLKALPKKDREFWAVQVIENEANVKQLEALISWKVKHQSAAQAFGHAFNIDDLLTPERPAERSTHSGQQEKIAMPDLDAEAGDETEDGADEAAERAEIARQFAEEKARKDGAEGTGRVKEPAAPPAARTIETPTAGPSEKDRAKEEAITKLWADHMGGLPAPSEAQGLWADRPGYSQARLAMKKFLASLPYAIAEMRTMFQQNYLHPEDALFFQRQAVETLHRLADDVAEMIDEEGRAVVSAEELSLEGAEPVAVG